MDFDAEVARASRDEACQAYSNVRKTRDELLQRVHKAKVALDEALRLSDEIWDDDEVDDLVLEFSRQRLPGFEDELDSAIEGLLEQQAALLQMSAEYNRKSDVYSALEDAARLEASSGAALPPRVPDDDAKAPAANSITYLTSQGVMNPSLGRETGINV